MESSTGAALLLHTFVVADAAQLLHFRWQVCVGPFWWVTFDYPLTLSLCDWVSIF